MSFKRTLSLSLSYVLSCVLQFAYAEEPSPTTNQSAPVEQPPAPTPEVAPKKSWQFAIGLGYMVSAKRGTFSDGKLTSGSTVVPGSAELDYKPAASLILEARKLAPNSWGFLGGLNYEGERQLDSGTVRGGGEVLLLQGNSSSSKIQFATFYGSAAYRWDSFYLPFGLNFSAVKFTPAQGSAATHSESGGLGAQLGVGYAFDSGFAIELYDWLTTMNLKTSTATSTVDFGKGYFESIVLVGKYAF